jgi:tubulin monoglycylase TTLL3/8
MKKKLEEEKKNKKDEQKPLTKEEKEQKWKEETFLNNTSSNTRPERLPQNENASDLLPEISDILEQLSKSMPQYDLGGTKNIWIVKPSGLSRGRGITCIDQLNDILSNIKLHNQTVIQKYIENPLVIKGRKFDMRQWVLVTNFNPLNIYLFDTPYIRFGAEDFHLDDFKNIFSQLTGNSIAKHSTKFDNSEIEGDMWEIEQFREFLKEKYKKDCWPEIQEKIKKIVIYSLQCAKHKIINRNNSHEILGFDIMIDDLLNVYLIEINLSPDWTYSTKVTEKLIKIASEDMMKVVIDVENEKKKTEKERKEIDTGRFKLIYSSSKFPKFDKPYVNKLFN